MVTTSTTQEGTMRARLVRITLATSAAALTLGLAGCGGADGPTGGTGQGARNHAAEELAAARQATLVPVATELELLDRAELRARLAGDPVQAAAVDEQLTAYRDLAAAIEAAPTADSVSTAVAASGLEPATFAAEDVDPQQG
jgi:hypothetical protein